MNFSTTPTPGQENTQPIVDAVGSVIVDADPNPVVSIQKGQELAIQNTSTSMATERDRVKAAIIASGEAQKLSDTLQINNPQTIIDFGKPFSEEMSKCADEILRRQDMQTLTQTSTMMSSLAKIMDKVDIGELRDLDKDPGFFGRIFKNAQNKLEQMMAKYNNIGTEIDKICVELKTYEGQIQQSNTDLETLYDNGVYNYKELIKYTIAGDIAIEEMDRYLDSLRVRAETDPQAQLDYQNGVQVKQLLEQRVQDLRMAETVALQSLPTIKAMEFGNLNLSRKIQSAFIVTIPVFKNACAQAIIAKRQALQAQALKELDDKTNEMLLKNAQNAANNMKMTAQLAGSSSIKIETIENSWQTIMQGIQDTKQIQAELARQREQDKVKLEQLNSGYLKQLNPSSGNN